MTWAKLKDLAAKYWLIALIVAIAVALGVGSARDEADPLDGSDAMRACQSFVNDRLGTEGKFVGVGVSGHGPWTVQGSVDATSSFGVSRRSDFTCVVHLDGGDFVLESLTGLQ